MFSLVRVLRSLYIVFHQSRCLELSGMNASVNSMSGTNHDRLRAFVSDHSMRCMCVPQAEAALAAVYLAPSINMRAQRER